MYYLLGISISLAGLFCLNLFASTIFAAAWRLIESFSRNWSARRRSAVIFAMRFLPSLLAVFLVCGLLLPAYLLFEPYSTNEKVTWKMLFPAVISLIGIVAAVYRIFGAWWKTRRLIKSFLKKSEPLFIENIPVPVYRILHPFPMDELFQFSGIASGAVIKDKTQFLLGFEDNRQIRSTVITSQVAPGTGFDGKYKQALFFSRLDHQINEANILTGRFNLERFTDSNANDAVSGSTEVNLPCLEL